MSSRIAYHSRWLAPAVASLLILAACAPSSDAGAPDAGASSAGSAEATVTTADSDHGEILTDADGMTIYHFANDTEGTSTCEAECLANWPPVTVEGEPVAGEGVTAELGTTTGTDGSTQLTVNGFPAYNFVGDEAAGDTNGQGVGDVWWVFGVDGEPIES